MEVTSPESRPLSRAASNSVSSLGQVYRQRTMAPSTEQGNAVPAGAASMIATAKDLSGNAEGMISQMK